MLKEKENIQKCTSGMFSSKCIRSLDAFSSCSLPPCEADQVSSFPTSGGVVLLWQLRHLIHASWNGRVLFTQNHLQTIWPHWLSIGWSYSASFVGLSLKLSESRCQLCSVFQVTHVIQLYRMQYESSLSNLLLFNAIEVFLSWQAIMIIETFLIY